MAASTMVGYLPPSQLWPGPDQGSGPSFLPTAPVLWPVMRSIHGGRSLKEQARNNPYGVECGWEKKKRAGLCIASATCSAELSQRASGKFFLADSHPLDAHL
jgi:hypothetical protein